MIRMLPMIVFLMMAGVLGCSSPEKRKAEADAQIAEQRAVIMKKYTECLEKEGENSIKRCAHYKDAATTLIKH
ncbi:MAG: hypothetical protein V3T61_03760 [Acidobacteriota bacterium]|nr:hypothetical protein [Nitrospirota bacterium]